MKSKGSAISRSKKQRNQKKQGKRNVMININNMKVSKIMIRLLLKIKILLKVIIKVKLKAMVKLKLIKSVVQMNQR